ncbi:hypothetical protein AMST5_01305 [freshwater sediment metagenome]|uniref:Uncharacterized protein n=1 Tax=freshwater sediment metagenome TaxID=556182 RepID=A0AA48M1B8_9ZZZZ
MVGGALAGKRVTQIAAGVHHSCAVTSDGGAFCWGSGEYGQLGNGAYSNSNVPVPVTATGVLAGKTVSQIVAGDYHTCAGTSDGGAYCWGLNFQGQLGNGGNANSNVPVPIDGSGELANKIVTELRSGGRHMIALAATPFFAVFDTKLKLSFGFAPNQDQFQFKADFTLNTTSNGIDPVVETTTLKIGAFSTSIPAGSFKLNKKQGFFTYSGVISGANLEVSIKPIAAGRYSFQAKGANLSFGVSAANPMPSPVPVTLRIGDDSGTTEVTAGNIY